MRLRCTWWGLPYRCSICRSAPTKNFGRWARSSLRRRDDAYPYLREHVQFHLDGRDRRSDFKYMLDLILEGLERDRKG